MKELSVKWQKLIVWLTGFVNIVAFVIAGGYLFKTTEHEEVKRSAKAALIVTAIFTAIEALCLFMAHCVNLAESATSWINKMNSVIIIVKIIVFAVLLILDLTIGSGSAKGANSPEAAEENSEKE